jgi:AraC-like DNA-binding protein
VAQSSGIPTGARVFLGGFLGSLGCIGALLGVRLTFGVHWAGSLQPYIAVLVAPLAYLGFRALMTDPVLLTGKGLVPHGMLVLACEVAILADPVLPDFIILGVTGFYLLGVVSLMRRGSDAIIRVPAHAIPVLRAALRGTLVLLTLIILADSFVAAVGHLKGTAYALDMLGGVSGVLVALVFVLTLSGVPMVLRWLGEIQARRQGPLPPSLGDRRLLLRIDAVLGEGKLYQDSALTVARLARKLGVPARDVTNATNRCAEQSFSRYVNGFRVRHACQMLRETALPITEIMLDSGFVSKSSFNGEFRRIVGRTPSQYRVTPCGGMDGTDPIPAPPRP